MLSNIISRMTATTNARTTSHNIEASSNNSNSDSSNEKNAEEPPPDSSVHNNNSSNSNKILNPHPMALISHLRKIKRKKRGRKYLKSHLIERNDMRRRKHIDKCISHIAFVLHGDKI